MFNLNTYDHLHLKGVYISCSSGQGVRMAEAFEQKPACFLFEIRLK